jgi:hypothetical protein
MAWVLYLRLYPSAELPVAVLLKSLYFLTGDPDRLRPSRCGFMQHVTVSIADHLSAAVRHMFPIIDLDPNDYSCIYSTLAFLEQQADQLNRSVEHEDNLCNCCGSRLLTWLKHRQ